MDGVEWVDAELLLTENTKTHTILITSDCEYHYGRMNYKKASDNSGSSLRPCTNVPLICPVCPDNSPNRTFWKYNLLYHMSIFHLDENGLLPHPFPRSLLVSTHITKAEELCLGVAEDETDDWRMSNLIPNSHQQIKENTVMSCDKLQFNPMATILSNRCKLYHNTM